MATLLFKFSDNLRIPPGAAWTKLLNLPADFHDHAGRFYQQVRTRPPAGGLSGVLLNALNQLLASALEQVLAISGTTPRSPFGTTAYPMLAQLADRLAAYVPVARGGQQPTMPALLNYFQLDLPDTLGEAAITKVLELLGRFLAPVKVGPFGAFTLPPLFDFVYLKGNPSPLAAAASPSALMGPNLNVGQFYFGDMAIPQPVQPGTKPDPKPLGGLTVVEAFGWYLDHPQFAGFYNKDPQKSRIRQVTFGTNPFNTQGISPQSGLLDHGTQILGMLIAKGGDADRQNPTADLCQGILAQESVSIRLVSCLEQGTVCIDGKLDPIRYNEAAAMLAAILNTPSGETILIELGTMGATLPLDVQPAIYELLTYADYLDITVVEAAGNGKKILDTVAAGSKPLLRVKDLRNKDEAHNTSYWSEYLNTDDAQAQLQALTRQYVGRNTSQTALGPAAQFSSIQAFLDVYNQTPSPAILVGAAFRAPSGLAGPLTMSNQGNRVRVFAQGNGILTTTPPSAAGSNLLFTGDMSDTSGAAAIIAGLVVLLQLAAKRNGKPVVAPPDMAAWLTSLPAAGQFTLVGGTTGIVPSFKTIIGHM